ncbi:MAG: NTF2 fold immunity protein [Inquilinus sp.]|uniref:NTF2 fold immunity protein n=1 Tax=Inquilinus sp. TaxID=1932117 RepID=UPI003F410552
MAEQPSDLSMVLRRAAGSDLVDSQLALTVAETLFRKEIGDERLEKQLPLQVTDLGPSWLVKGTPNALNPGQSPTGLRDDYTEIVISKADCRIIRFATVGGFP